jgi:hypothetical protein
MGSPYKKVLNEAQQASKGKGSSSKRPSKGKQMKQKKSKVSKSQVDVIVDCDDTVCLTCGEFYRDSAPGESGYNAMSVKIGHTKTVPIS